MILSCGYQRNFRSQIQELENIQSTEMIVKHLNFSHELVLLITRSHLFLLEKNLTIISRQKDGLEFFEEKGLLENIIFFF